MVQLLILTITIIIAVFYILTLHRTLTAINPGNREITPAVLWLLLIPLFNIFFHLYVVIKLSASISKEILSKGQELKVFRPTYGAGLIVSVGFIITTTISALKLDIYTPFAVLSGLCSVVAIISGIIYWVQVYKYGSVVKTLSQ